MALTASLPYGGEHRRRLQGDVGGIMTAAAGGIVRQVVQASHKTLQRRRAELCHTHIAKI